jgi:2-amino-4-hydroxy-6-hydroxymethyldihydropteridine diphosphokinase
MILVAIGSNQTGPWGSPVETVKRALMQLDRDALKLRNASRLLKTTAFGRTNQPDFVNAVVEITTSLSPEALLLKLHLIERLAGRRRVLRWGPRTLDLDLIDYHGLVRKAPLRPLLPHPGIAEREFVLKPIAEIAPRWRHPILHRSAAQLLRRLAMTGAGREIKP